MNSSQPQQDSAPKGPGALPQRSSGGSGPDTQIRRLALFGTKGVVGRSRDFARDSLHDWNWLPATDNPDRQASADDVLLVVSELVTNACLHAGGPTSLQLRGSADMVRVEVYDPSAQRPRPRTVQDRARPGGHGLYVIDRLARRWGVTVHQDGSGKAVWAEVAAPPNY